MQSLQDLLNFILQQDRCIVYGDLGRYPQHLLESFKSFPMLKVVVVSRNADLHSTDNRIRVVRSAELVEKCDLLVYLEPASMQVVEKHPLALRVAVFASHYTFKTPCGDWWTDVCFFVKRDSEGTRQLLEKQDFSIQTRNVGLVKVDYTNVLTISGNNSAPPDSEDTYVIVDLTKFSKDTLSMYLAFWDAFDFMLENKNLIHKWVVCFSENGRQAFERFTQKVLDSLLCKKFEHGNVKDIKTLVTLLPFYKSGTIDEKFDVELFTFGGFKFAVPKTVEDACKVAAMYDVHPLVKNVFLIRE